MKAATISGKNRGKVEEALKCTYLIALKSYRAFSESRTKQCLEKNLESSWKFFNQFRKDIFNIGAIAPSSKSLANYITSIINLSEKKSVVELGSGTGIFTKKISKKISKTSTFFALEINEYFASQTKQNCPDVTVYQDNAKNIQKYLNDNGKESCDCIISGLPWSCFDENKQEELINSIYNSLEDGGEFLTFAYIQSSFLPQGIKFKELLEKKFKVTIQTKTVWTNLPPAFVYICTK